MAVMSLTLWEYDSIVVETKGIVTRGKIDADATDSWLNERGAAGWELVAVTAIGDGAVGTARLLYTLKRRKQILQ